MLYLRTGGNGSGKTLLTLRDVRDLQLQTQRPVYFNGRFKAKPILTDEFGWRQFDFENWQDLPDGAIILVDECHYDLPQRAQTKAPPPHIAKLTEHRSRGFDFFLLTQHPANIDAFVRKLVQAPGWHQHIKRLGGALPVANVIQWDSVELQCEKAGSGKTGEVKTRPYPKEVYEWYDSATIHTGKKRIPRQVWVLLACLLLVPVLLYLGITGVTKKATKPAEQAAAAGTAGGTPEPRQTGPKTAQQLLSSYVPRVPGFQHTAPVYDTLTQPKRVPVPAACVESKSGGCKCYTQDATAYPTTEDICQRIVRHGIFLDFPPEGMQVQHGQQAQLVRPQPAQQQQQQLQQAQPLQQVVQASLPAGLPTAPEPGPAAVAEAAVNRVYKDSPWRAP